jgi:DNA-binding response OmpR family regulator
VRHAEPVDRLIFASGHACQHFIASTPFLASESSQFPDLLLTDRWAGERPAEDVIARARSIVPGLPVMLMTSSRESEIVAALHAGADDCLTKPVRGPEMPARVHALLRRPSNRRCDVFGGYVFDAANFTVTFHGPTVALTPKEFRVARGYCSLLFNNVSRPVSRAHPRNRAGTPARRKVAHARHARVAGADQIAVASRTGLLPDIALRPRLPA